ncbi:unnamed protein product, partial [Rotaria sp. Silwood2]
MDETTDISRYEQVSLVIRYTDGQFHVYERASSTTGDVGQCFDGTSAMRGTYKGVAERLIQIVPTALYIHCNKHILNLCLIDVAQAVVPIRNNFGVMKSLYNLIEGSAKRHKDFEDIQKEVCLVPIPLKQLGNTRWTCRFESLKVILKQYSEIIADLQEMEVAD